MNEILIEDLREDVLDRMDNSVIAQQIGEALRTKLRAKPRVTHAINQAIVLFIRDADVSTVSKFISIVDCAPDTNIGANNDGVSGGIKTYLWPEDAFEARSMDGLIKISLNENEFTITENNNMSLESLRYHAGSKYYGSNYEVFSVDALNRRIYAPKDVQVKARIVAYPEKVDDNDTYGAENAATIPLSDAFIQTLSQLALNDLLKTGSNAPNRQQVIQDTAQQPQPQPEANG